MAYVDQTRMERLYTRARLVELTDDSNTGMIDAAVLNTVLDEASGEVDVVLQAAGWTLPLSNVPEWVRTATSKIAIYLLYQRRGRVPADVDREYRQAKADLEKIARQEIKAMEASDASVEATVTTRDVVFKQTDTKGL